MIKQLSLHTLEKAINHTLALDETSPFKIESLHGKTIEIIIDSLGAHFFIHFADKQLQLRADSPAAADTTIHSSPLGLIRLSLLPASKARSLFNDKIRITGDLELGQSVKQLFDELDIDWEGHLAHFTGDVIAHQVGTMIKKGLAFQYHLTSSFRQSFVEFLQEEQRFFPSREEADDFFNDIDTLVLDVERLEATINLLKRHS